MINDKLLADIKAHAAESAPRECCGLIVTYRRKKTYHRCRNIATARNDDFIMHPDDYAAAEDKGTVLAIVHSHVNVSPKPSQADLVSIERNGLPWVIVNHPVGTWTVTEPSGYVAPLVGREFVHGVLDCLTLICDHYDQSIGIVLKDRNGDLLKNIPREPEWWLKGQDMYRDHMDEAGFVEVPFEQLRKHDVILMRVASPVENHGAIYLGDNIILHHVHGQLSGRNPYGGWWRRITTGVLRHKALLP